jgi:hypothetical protein
LLLLESKPALPSRFQNLDFWVGPRGRHQLEGVRRDRSTGTLTMKTLSLPQVREEGLPRARASFSANKGRHGCALQTQPTSLAIPLIPYLVT